MKSAVLLLLSCLSPVLSQGQSGTSVPLEDDDDVRTQLPILWDELRGLKALVLSLRVEEVERRQVLRSVESRLRDGEVEDERQRRRLDRLKETELTELRRKVEQLEEQSKALAVELPYLQTRLRANENTVEQLRRKNAVLAARLCSAESLMEGLRTQISVANTSSDEARTHLEEPSSHTDAPVSVVTSRRMEAADHDDSKQLQLRLESAETLMQQLQNHTADQSFTLMNLQRKVTSSEILLDRLNSEVEVKLNVTEEQLQQLRVEFTALETRLAHVNNTAALDVRLRSTESHLEQLETLTAGLELRLSLSEKHLEDVKEVTTVQVSLIESRLTDNNRSAAALDVRLKSTETQVEELQSRAAGLELRLSLGEQQLEDVKEVNTEHEAELSVLMLSLNVTQQQLNEVRTRSSVLQVRLSVGEDAMDELRTQSQELQQRLNVTERQVDKLRSNTEDDLKVAFSAGLTDSGPVGPFDEETTLIFSKLISNVGGAYDQAAGVFTAPVSGVYFFSFTAADYLKGYMGLHLYRNERPVVFNLHLNDHGGYASTSTGVVLQLEARDRVRLSLPASYRLYDDSRSFSVFSGFLLFSL